MLASHRARVSANSWLGLGIALAFAGGCTKAPLFPEEAAALKTLTDDYKLTRHKKDKEGHVIDVTMEGPHFDDQSLAVAGSFLELRGMSIAPVAGHGRRPGKPAGVQESAAAQHQCLLQ